MYVNNLNRLVFRCRDSRCFRCGYYGVAGSRNPRHCPAAFEENFNKQYRKLARAIPVDVLLGKPVKDHLKLSTREENFCYLDFSSEQALYRSNGRIRKNTWLSWATGIKAHIEKEEFGKVWDEVYSHSPDTFSYLARLKDEYFKIDPKCWGSMVAYEKSTTSTLDQIEHAEKVLDYHSI